MIIKKKKMIIRSILVFWIFDGSYPVCRIIVSGAYARRNFFPFLYWFCKYNKKRKENRAWKASSHSIKKKKKKKKTTTTTTTTKVNSTETFSWSIHQLLKQFLQQLPTERTMVRPVLIETRALITRIVGIVSDATDGFKAEADNDSLIKNKNITKRVGDNKIVSLHAISNSNNCTQRKEHIHCCLRSLPPLPLLI